MTDGLAGGVELFEQVDDLATGLRIEVSGGLVGEHDIGIVGEGARDRDALALAAGELDGAMVEALAEADRVEQSLGTGAAFAASDTGERECDLDVLSRGQHLQEIEGLEDETECVQSQRGAALEAERLGGAAADADFAVGRRVDQAEQMQQRRFAAAAGSGDRDEVALLDLDIDAAQGVDRLRADAVRAGEVLSGEQGLALLAHTSLIAERDDRVDADRAGGRQQGGKYPEAGQDPGGAELDLAAADAGGVGPERLADDDV